MTKFWAHSDRNGLPLEAPNSKAQLLAEHLHHLAVLAERLAKSATPEEAAVHQMAYLAGMLHDYGKYTECFQQRIRGSDRRCPHSIFGATAARQFGLRPGEKVRSWAMPVVHAIAAHHGGLRDHSELDSDTKPINESAPVEEQRRIARASSPTIPPTCVVSRISPAPSAVAPVRGAWIETAWPRADSAFGTGRAP